MKPKLRPIEVHPTAEGYLVSDPTGIAEATLVLSPEALYLASRFTGEASLEELAAALQQEGSPIPLEKLKELAEALEKAGFLETPEVLARVRAAEAELKEKPKPMRHAGSSYPPEAEAFKLYLNTFRAVAPAVPEKAAKALLMPHLEPRRVPEVYGAAIEALRATPAPERVLVLGVAHRPIPHPVAALPRGLETPLGVMEADLDALAALDALLGTELFDGLLALRDEHALEFPAVFLKAIWPESKILPLAVASDDETALAELAEALWLLHRDRPFFPVLAVDLSHVGARFGHPPLDRALADKAKQRDLGYLQALAQGDFTGAFRQLKEAENDTFIDALGPARAAAKVIEGEGRLLDYTLSAEVDTASAVGAGTLAWY